VGEGTDHPTKHNALSLSSSPNRGVTLCRGGGLLGLLGVVFIRGDDVKARERQRCQHSGNFGRQLAAVRQKFDRSPSDRVDKSQ
jgi:hypothetical protein